MRIQRIQQVVLAATVLIVSACSEQSQETAVEEIQGDRISATVETVQTSTLSADESAAVAKAASRVLLHAMQARGALSDKNTTEAQDNIVKGLQLLDIISEALPEYKVTSKIAAGDLTYTDESNVKPGRVPIYTNYGELSVLKDVTGSESQKREGMVVADVEDYVSSALLDIHTARTSFNAARNAIEEENFSDADAYLGSVLGSLSYELIEVHEPLVAARENLILAKDEVTESRWRAARIALETASTEIDQQATREKGDDAKTLHDMATKVQALAEDVESHAKTAPDSIDKWQDQLEKMR